MPLLVISKFDEDPIKMKTLCPGQHLPHYKSMGKISDAQGRVTPNRIVRYGPNSKFTEILPLS